MRIWARRFWSFLLRTRISSERTSPLPQTNSSRNSFTLHSLQKVMLRSSFAFLLFVFPLSAYVDSYVSEKAKGSVQCDDSEEALREQVSFRWTNQTTVDWTSNSTRMVRNTILSFLLLFCLSFFLLPLRLLHLLLILLFFFLLSSFLRLASSSYSFFLFFLLPLPLLPLLIRSLFLSSFFSLVLFR